MNLLDLVLSREKRMAAPLVTYPALKLLGADVDQALGDPEIHSEAAKLTLTEFGLDMMLPLMDLTVEAEAMGA
ncbi:MAG: methylcobamide--CoM methyltransferase, partial [Candidatus Korarchaeota archaeon]|nr:methylcobamide--CoM methyltransferase [Candidatus Korarchaeota archaeon]